ncbi:hypothetical protein ABZX63_28995, partial [Streptomyces tendae]
MTEYTDHHTPQGLRTRGTVVVVPGRGESHATYNRFGRRLAADAYRVRVVNAPDLDPGDTDGPLARFGRQLAAAVEGTAAGPGCRKVVGTDLVVFPRNPLPLETAGVKVTRE